MSWIKVFAPATIANVGPGFDVLGMAVEGWGDTVEASRSESGVSIAEVISEYPIPSDTESNTASLAAKEVLNELGDPGGIQLRIIKGLPGGSGLGSSAASAAAGAFAANYLYGNRLTPEQLITAATEAEAVVSGRHADNTAAAILGGAVAVRSASPLDVIRLGSISDLRLIIITPDVEVLTKDARSILPGEIPLPKSVTAMANTAGITAALLSDDYELFIRCLRDVMAEPTRKGFIPHFDLVKQSAIAGGADGVIISGSGPTLCAFSNRSKKECEAIRGAMDREFEKGGITTRSIVTAMDPLGTRII